MTKRQLISLSTSVALLATAVILVPVASANSNCNGQYGDGSYGQVECPPIDLTIDKKVRNPITGEYQDNLLAGDAAYSPDAEVLYSLKVTNSGASTFKTQVSDTLPDQLKEPQVHQDDASKVTDVQVTGNTIKFVLKEEFKAGETRKVRLKAKVKSAGSFEASKNLHCDITNQVVVTADNRSDNDEAKLCVQTQVLGVTTLPEAGPEDYLPLVPFLALGVAGIALFLKKPVIFAG